jgi:GT2 family glycosyltransferase
MLGLSQIAVVILNYNGIKHLQTFLPSILVNSGSAKVVVADNGSTDGSVEWIKTLSDKVELLLLEKNYGFCGGYNRALRQIEAKYYVLLNSDVEATPNWLEPMLELMESDPQIAACQPKVKSYLLKTHFEYAGAAGGFLDRFGYPFCRGRLFDTLEADQGQFDDTVEIFWATGACMMIRAEVYHRFSGLDEAFFAHMEEIDLCWRIRNEGLKIFYCGQSTVFHLGGGTLNATNPRKVFYNFRNGLMLLSKNLRRRKWLYVTLLRLVLDGIAAIRFLFLGKVDFFWAVFSAHIDFYRHLGYLLEYRKKSLASGRRKKHYEGYYPRSIAFDYFVLRNKTFHSIRWNPKSPLSTKTNR